MARAFRALIDRDDLVAWLPPEGMSATFERFDPRPGGTFRLVLTYDDPPDVGGKSTPDSDVVEARYLDIVPDVRVVQAIDFVSEDSAFAGTMIMTWAVTAVEGGTLVEITAEEVPDGISADDHAAGLASSLANLARHLCGGHPGPQRTAHAPFDEAVAPRPEEPAEHPAGRPNPDRHPDDPDRYPGGHGRHL